MNYEIEVDCRSRSLNECWHHRPAHDSLCHDHSWCKSCTRTFTSVKYMTITFTEIKIENSFRITQSRLINVANWLYKRHKLSKIEVPLNLLNWEIDRKRPKLRATIKLLVFSMSFFTSSARFQSEFSVVFHLTPELAPNLCPRFLPFCHFPRFPRSFHIRIRQGISIMIQLSILWFEGQWFEVQRKSRCDKGKAEKNATAKPSKATRKEQDTYRRSQFRSVTINFSI
jgi:hypothetical protein